MLARSMMVTALVFIQPRSSCVVGSWKRARMWVTTAYLPSGETRMSFRPPLPLGSESSLTTWPAAVSMTLTTAATCSASARPACRMIGHEQRLLPSGVSAAATGSRWTGTRRVSFFAARSMTLTSLLKRLQTKSVLPSGLSTGARRGVAGGKRACRSCPWPCPPPHPACGGGAGHVEPGAIGRQGQAGGRIRHRDAAGHFARRHVEGDHPVAGGAGDVERVAIRRRRQRGRGEVGRPGSPGRQCGQEAQGQP